ncbi:hypothetical protein ACWC5I_38690, partial [Kitasatospora sp. NPDC001574]
MTDRTSPDGGPRRRPAARTKALMAAAALLAAVAGPVGVAVAVSIRVIRPGFSVWATRTRPQSAECASPVTGSAGTGPHMTVLHSRNADAADAADAKDATDAKDLE